MGVATTYRAGRSIDSFGGSLDTAVMSVAVSFRPARARIALLFSLVLFAACGPQQAVKPAAPVAPPPDATALSHLGNGNFPAAAREYERLANTGSPEAARYRSLAAIAYADSGDFTTARSVLEQQPAAADSLYTLALAASDELRDGGAMAAQQLAAVNYGRLTPYQRSVYERVRGRLALARQNFADAAKAFIAADTYPLPATQRADLHKDTWRALSAMDATALAAARATATGREAGWLALAMSARPALHDSAALTTAIESWRATHAQHPANASLVEHLYELAETLTAGTRHVALLLPLDGRYADAANAFKDGFLSAWFADPQTDNRPIVSVYSAGDETINAVYDEAVQNGADFVVGPLTKPAVENLMRRAELPVRTLALNSASSAGPAAIAGAAFFQFGLTPENEARSVAEKAWADGHSRAVVMAPRTDWGKRVATAFRERWQELGGSLLSEVTFGGEEATYSRAVKAALNIDLSEARAGELRRALGRSIHFEPRRRADVDTIFLAGFPISARQLMPQFRYFRAEDVPMYATSHTYEGRPDPGLDQDLDGLVFGDMPWLFGTPDSANIDMFKRSWPDSAAGSGRLFAFGLDAYRVLPYLVRMRHQPGLHIPGATGVLHVNSEGHVVRDLAWAKFAGGSPRPLQ